MTQQPSTPLRIVRGDRLAPEFRRVLRPGERMLDREGRARRLPDYFYEIRSWDEALETQLTPHFGLWEFIDVDVREAEVMRMFPRYVPCGITLLATHLEIFRQEVGTMVRVAANGGYRSPGHQLSRFASPHCWGTAANVYLVGEEFMDSREKIEKYTQIARRVLPGIWSRPYGAATGCVFDHVHIDLGYATITPVDAPGDDDAGS